MSESTPVVPRAVLYTRVSTQSQTEGTSLESQYLACAKKAAEMGAAVVEIVEDAGVSGGDYVTREGIQTALKLIESGEADTLIIYDMSRYSRDAIHQQQILNRVIAAGGNLVFTTFDLGDLRDNPEGRLAFGVQGVFAEYERRRIRRQMMQGRRASAEKGLQVTSRAPWGYEIATRDKIMEGRYKIEDHKKYFIVQEHAARIRDLFQRYASGQSQYGIAQDFNTAGYPTPGGARVWLQSTISQILRNETYAGIAYFGALVTVHDESRLEKGFKSKIRYKKALPDQRVAIAVPPIVERDVWEKCQERLRENKARLGGRPSHRHFLSSLLRCPSCGKKMFGRIMAKGSYKNQSDTEALYTCARAAHGHMEYRCRGGYFRGSQLERKVLEKFIELATDPEKLEAAFLKQFESKHPTKPRTRGKVDLHKRLKELEKREAATVKAQINALRKNIASKHYETELVTITRERDAIQKQLDDAAKQSLKPQLMKTRAARAYLMLREALEVLTDETVPVLKKRELLMEYVAAIYPKRAGAHGVSVTLEWREGLFLSEKT